MARPKTISEKPNIVLMVSDDHGCEALGCYGNTGIATPHLDALAADGVRFTNAFCTSASCSPSRSVILTGLHTHTNGCYGLSHAQHHFCCFETVETLPSMIAACGYRTGRIGKTHYAPENIFPFGWHGTDCDRDDVLMAENCRDFFKGEQPFFLYWCSHNPHRKGVLASHPLRPDHFGNPERSFPGDAETTYNEKDVTVPPFLNDTPEVRAELAQYYQSVSRLDRGAGRLVQILKEAGVYENTLIIYVSDNGVAFPEAKTTLYEPGMRLPCIVRSPWQDWRGTVCNGLLSWTDLTPTILDFAGVDADYSRFHGCSIKGILDQEEPSDWRNEVFASHNFHQVTNYYPMRVVRTRKHKFIWNIAWKLDYPSASDLWQSASWQGALRAGTQRFGVRTIDAYLHRPKFELYDLVNDPDEVVNLAERPDYSALVGTFAEKIRQFQEQTGDPWLHKWEYE